MRRFPQDAEALAPLIAEANGRSVFGFSLS